MNFGDADSNFKNKKRKSQSQVNEYKSLKSSLDKEFIELFAKK